MTLARVLILVALGIAGCLPCQAQSATPAVKLPFAFVTNQVEGFSFPFGGLFLASCKEDSKFVIVATTEIPPKGKRLPSTELNHVLIDDSKKEYKAVAFGLPRKWRDTPVLFIVHGYSFTGEIENELPMPTVMGLLYLVPKQAKGFALKRTTGKVERLEVLKGFMVPETMTSFGFITYGKLLFGAPSIDKDGWGLKSN